MNDYGQTDFRNDTQDNNFSNLLKLTESYSEFSALGNISYLTILLQFLTVAGYIYFVVVNIRNAHIFYLLVSMSVVQGVLTLADTLFFREFFYDLSSRKLVRRKNTEMLTKGIVKIASGSPWSGIAEIMLWSTVAGMWKHKQSNVIFSDLHRAMANSSAIILMGVLLFLTLRFPSETFELVYLYSLIAFGILGEAFVLKFRYERGANLKKNTYSILIYSDFYLAVLFLMHFTVNRFYSDWNLLLFIEFVSLGLIDFFGTRLYIKSMIDYKTSVWFLRVVMGGSGLLIGLFFLGGDDIFGKLIAYMYGMNVFPLIHTPEATVILYFGISLVVVFGFPILSYIMHTFFSGYKDSNEKVERELNFEYEPILDRVRKAAKEYRNKKETIIKRLEGELKSLKDLITMSKNKWFQEGYDKATKEFSKMKRDFYNQKPDKEADKKLLDLLFQVNAAPRDSEKRKEFFKRIYVKLTHIYHPDANKGGDTNRIMQIINDYYERLTKL